MHELKLNIFKKRNDERNARKNPTRNSILNSIRNQFMYNDRLMWWCFSIHANVFTFMNEKMPGIMKMQLKKTKIAQFANTLKEMW